MLQDGVNRYLVIREEVNEMAIPGFTAESSLSKTNEPYEMVGSPDPLASGQEIVAQKCVFVCRDICTETEDEINCRWFCYWECNIPEGPGPMMP
jgi:hypothetical protein